MGSTKARYRGGQIAFFDNTTQETTAPLAPRYLFDDFEGVTYNTLQWLYADNAEGTEALDGVGNAIFTLDATANNQEAGIVNQGNVLSWDTDKGLVVEYRAAFTVVPTVGTEGLLGVLGEAQVDDQQIVAADDYAEHAVFAVTINGLCSIHTDDGTHQNGPVATGVTITAGVYHVFRIDFTDIANVLFFIDGVQVAKTTTFIMHDLASHLVQPFVNLTKTGADAGLGTIALDYIKIWQATR
jgi:hypothetical protein